MTRSVRMQASKNRAFDWRNSGRVRQERMREPKTRMPIASPIHQENQAGIKSLVGIAPDSQLLVTPRVALIMALKSAHKKIKATTRKKL